jgi:hypothetical protein
MKNVRNLFRYGATLTMCMQFKHGARQLWRGKRGRPVSARDDVSYCRGAFPPRIKIPLGSSQADRRRRFFLLLQTTVETNSPGGFSHKQGPAAIGFRNVFLKWDSFFIRHCFISRPSDFTVSEDAGIEPRTVATSTLAVRRSNNST